MITNPYSRNIGVNGIPKLSKTAENMHIRQDIVGHMASTKATASKTYAPRYPDDHESEHEKVSTHMDEEATLLLADEIIKAERSNGSRNHQYPPQFIS